MFFDYSYFVLVASDRCSKMIIPAAESNHGGDMRFAREMIRVVKDCGCEIIKFQLYNAEDDKGKPHYEWVKKAELSFEQAKMLFDYGKEVGIEVFFSVFGIKYVDWCEKIGVKRYKLSSSFSGCYDTWLALKQTSKPIIFSFSILPLDCKVEAEDEILYCPPGYPSELSYIPDFDEEIYFTGFSDHSIGSDAAKIALARGASIIEKHFILARDHSLSPEREWSMNPEELQELKRFEKVVKECLH